MNFYKVVRLEPVASDMGVEDGIKEVFEYARENNVVVEVNINGVELKIYRFFHLQYFIDEYWRMIKGDDKKSRMDRYKKDIKKAYKCYKMVNIEYLLLDYVMDYPKRENLTQKEIIELYEYANNLLITGGKR